ncbi:DinB family protein [Amycolatopsis alkalitolerans]|uniref:DinB family protein n=1 Tax=Amycolatopsis alkalitolerans TaxID=2547244 RepID=A0A5C4LYS5_9PSEU|nr:DinB family protein [Amycolatopsis alkalitolerans]TNC23133.1 DinB family protein [Amycolatopsis alkalitolerans]
MSGNVRPVRDEREGLLAFLAHQRYVLRLAAHGLTDEQARLAPSRSTLTIGGLLKHVARTERGWLGTVLQRKPVGTVEERASAYAADFEFTEEDTLPAVLAEYEQVAGETEEIIAGIPDLGRPVPVPKGVPWFPDDVDAWSVRWVLLHLIQETARHAGHADIVREHIDGAQAFPLLAAAEGWPPSPWIQPWQPPPP